VLCDQGSSSKSEHSQSHKKQTVHYTASVRRRRKRFYESLLILGGEKISSKWNKSVKLGTDRRMRTIGFPIRIHELGFRVRMSCTPRMMLRTTSVWWKGTNQLEDHRN
jgi:hypothetical protein